VYKSQEQELLAINRQLKNTNEKEMWKKFNLSFSKVHSNFTSNLTSAHPVLTPSDIKLCSFIMLGMANKEIAPLMHSTSDSVKVSRYRIRKKMGLEKGTNLQNYLARF
jgi:DNA-binding NarL/FixJ family response regulator